METKKLIILALFFSLSVNAQQMKLYQITWNIYTFDIPSIEKLKITCDSMIKINTITDYYNYNLFVIDSIKFENTTLLDSIHIHKNFPLKDIKKICFSINRDSIFIHSNIIYKYKICNLDSVYFISSLITDIEDNSINDIEVFPNPTSEYIYINTNESDCNLSEISIFDIQGKKVNTYSVDNTASKISLSVNDLNEGIYILQLKTDKGILNKKILIN